MMSVVTYPTPGYRLIARQYRVHATPFATETDALAAIMEHKASNPENDYSVRDYRGEGFFVLIQFPSSDSRWLAYLPARHEHEPPE